MLGTVNYPAKFLPHISQVSELLRQVTKKDHPYVWNETYEAAFAEFKKLIMEPSVLKYYEPQKPLVVQCDASDHGLGAALVQEGKPIAFASQTSNTEKHKGAIGHHLWNGTFPPAYLWSSCHSRVRPQAPGGDSQKKPYLQLLTASIRHNHPLQERNRNVAGRHPQPPSFRAFRLRY